MRRQTCLLFVLFHGKSKTGARLPTDQQNVIYYE